MTGGIASRQKGVVWERRVAEFLRGVWPTCRRGAVGTTGADMRGIPVAVECKDQATIALPAWWRQTVTQATEAGMPPVLVIKRRSHSRPADAMWVTSGEFMAELLACWEAHRDQ